MYSLGQTLFDKKNNELVLYLGCMFTKKSKIWIKRRNGKVERIDSFDNLIHIANKNGRPITGKHSFSSYFGRLKHKYYKNLLPDKSISPDNINFFRGDKIEDKRFSP